ncbi:hypothetical protein GCM10012287_44670 [Streptomyces daqingensis]|uniref:Uncharacterized protein n=1 Tax=Streptomyces daqingensis TaxID=1472640 RepID=A0ABQ2MN96_9ACTN|nr:hypothetical protein GCM10012287_44670 [Streptomyces daqingensis]
MPAAFTLSPSSAARRTASARPAVEEGETVRAGEAVTFPAQFCHVVPPLRDVRAVRLLGGCAFI